MVVHEIETNQNGKSEVEIQLDEGTENNLWIELPKKGLLIWSVILFIAQVGLYKNRRRPDAPKSYLQLLKRLDLSFLEEVADDYYQPTELATGIPCKAGFCFSFCVLFSI